MVRELKLQSFFNHITREKKVSIGLVIIFILIVLKVYGYGNSLSNQQGALLFYQWAMPSKEKVIESGVIREKFIYDVQKLLDPVHILYSAMPYYKSKSISLGLYDEELGGYFGIPTREELLTLEEENTYTPIFPTPQKQVVEVDRLSDVAYLKSTFFMGGDGQLAIDETLLGQWDFTALAEAPIRIDESIEGPKAIIFHTHSKEKYVGADPLVEEDPGIVQVGEALAELLETKYGIETLHVTDSFYIDEESLSVTGAYERMEAVISSIISQNPSLQIAIDLHRDGFDNPELVLVGDYKGQEAAKFMFVNGLCQTTNKDGEIVNMQSLTNPYIEDNLAFSMQAQIEAMKYYPDLVRKIYLKAYRYSTHMLPYSLLIEVGANTNTFEQALVTAAPIADVLAKVLQKD